jgi:hypothetical protein
VGRGVSGIGVAVAAGGSILLYAGFRNVTPLDALKAVTSGKLTPLPTGDGVGGPAGRTSGAGAEHGGRPTESVLVAFGKQAQSDGYAVSEHPSFGGVTKGAHVPGSKHYSGLAIDINHGAGTSKAEQEALALLVPKAKAAGLHTIFMAPGHYNHLHVDVP